ncbi:MAG: hypothetical protein IJT73_08255 [Selenomonadaceae bacterium]|nr:hypothetical protein [Selenomonadaceae bacterium]
MIDLNIIASGSKGNCTAATSGTVTILLDAGIAFDRIQRALDFKNPTACFITHEHGDHANKATIAELLKRGTDIYMTAGTANALKLETSHRLHLIESKKLYELDDSIPIRFYATPTVHDAAEPVSFHFNWNFETLVYIVDTGYLPPFDTVRNYLLIEANHSTADLLNANIDDSQKQRILQNHLSIEKVVKYIEDNNQGNLAEVHLIHISKRHGDGEQFRQAVQAVVGDKIKVLAH